MIIKLSTQQRCWGFLSPHIDHKSLQLSTEMMMNCCNHVMLCNRVSWMSSTIEDSLQSSELCAFKITTDYCLVRLTIRLMKRHSSHFFILFEYFFCFVKENKLLLALTTRSSKLWSFRCDFFVIMF